MTELQGAVALAQLERVDEITSRRNQLGTRLNELLRAMPGIVTQPVPPGCLHSYFLYLFKLELDRLGCTSREFSTALAAEGLPNEAHQITGGRPIYLFDLFQKRSAFPGSTYPFGNREYRPGDCPVAEAAFSRWITMNIYEHFTDRDIEEIAFGISKVAHHFAARQVASSNPSTGRAV
jgi:dTDP-4-amino-4,6-dideoxygalactose transaminase